MQYDTNIRIFGPLKLNNVFAYVSALHREHGRKNKINIIRIVNEAFTVGQINDSELFFQGNIVSGLLFTEHVYGGQLSTPNNRTVEISKKHILIYQLDTRDKYECCNF